MILLCVFKDFLLFARSADSSGRLKKLETSPQHVLFGVPVKASRAQREIPLVHWLADLKPVDGRSAQGHGEPRGLAHNRTPLKYLLFDCFEWCLGN